MAAPLPPPQLPNPVPRPAVWEVPDLKDETKYFMRLPPLLPSIPDSFWDSLLDYQWYCLARAVRGRTDAFRQANVSRRRWGTGMWPDVKRDDVQAFLRKSVNFNNDASWEPLRLLGVGRYGIAGLWVKRDGGGTVVDELVVKQQVDGLDGQGTRYSEIEPAYGPFRGLLSEDVIQKQMNEHSCENILHLRGYAFMSNNHAAFVQPRGRKRKRPLGDDSPRRSPSPIPDYEFGQYRHYLEYCPHQTLHDLAQRYRAWDSLLPEAFLWHVFDSLAAAIQVLAQGPERKFSSTGITRLTARFWPRRWGVVHYDLRPQNIFLGYEQYRNENTEVNGGSVVLRYPVVKLADFGIAMITGPGDVNNPGDDGTREGHKWRKPEAYTPPEQNEWGFNWGNPPNNKDSLYYGNAANVWNVGKTLYDCMTCSRPHDLDTIMGPPGHELTNQANRRVAMYRENGYHFLSPNQWRTRPLQQSRVDGNGNLPAAVPLPYSDELINLVFECLRPAIARRIHVDELRIRTKAGLVAAENAANVAAQGQRTPDKPWRRPKTNRNPLPATYNPPVVYHDHNNVANTPMPLGNTVFPGLDGEYRQQISRMYADPSMGILAPPGPKWQNEIVQWGGWNALNLHPPAAYHRVNGRIYFNGVAPGGTGPGSPPGGGGGGGGGGNGGGGNGGGGNGGGGNGGGGNARRGKAKGLGPGRGQGFGQGHGGGRGDGGTNGQRNNGSNNPNGQPKIPTSQALAYFTNPAIQAAGGGQGMGPPLQANNNNASTDTNVP